MTQKEKDGKPGADSHPLNNSTPPAKPLPRARHGLTFRGDPDWWEAQEILEESRRNRGEW